MIWLYMALAVLGLVSVGRGLLLILWGLGQLLLLPFMGRPGEDDQ